MTKILVISARVDDRRGLDPILNGTEWSVVDAADIVRAIDALKRSAFPIVLFDRDLAGGAWQDTLRMLRAASDRACVILLSNVSDEYLWNEVISLGGFDVLTRPFHKDQVVSMLDFAHTYWKTTWPAMKG